MVIIIVHERGKDDMFSNNEFSNNEISSLILFLNQALTNAATNKMIGISPDHFVIINFLLCG